MIRPSGLDLGIVSSRKLESMSRCLVLFFSLSCLVQSELGTCQWEVHVVSSTTPPRCSRHHILYETRDREKGPR